MEQPDERQMLADLEDAPFLIGQSLGRWGRIEVPVPPWPTMIFWVAAAERVNSPRRFYLRLDCAGYRIESPTGTFWDPGTKEMLAHCLWPKGIGRVKAVFRVDWEGGTRLYHPFDRISMQKHSNWSREYPHLVWTRDHSIADYLAVIHGLLNSKEYTGV